MVAEVSVTLVGLSISWSIWYSEQRKISCRVWGSNETLLTSQLIITYVPGGSRYRAVSVKLRSLERGKGWETIASHLNATSHPKYRVTPRSVRDRYNLLTKKFQIRLNREERASGF